MKVSIITIVYNNADCILDCLGSVQSQTHQDIEHVVIDGGSKDGTQELIKPFISQLGFYLSEPDNGLYDALNKGIQHCTGDVIGILHSDDLFYHKDTVADIVRFFKITSADLVYANGVYTDKTHLDTIKRIYDSKPFKGIYLYFGWIPLHTTIYVKKEVFDKHGLYEENFQIAGDYEISLRWFTMKSIRKEFLNKFVVKMRLGGKSTTLNLQKLKSSEDYKIILKYKLLGIITLAFKIARKIPQYIKPKIFKL